MLDSREELSDDALLQGHCAECYDCRQTMESYQSLEDSFSGKSLSSFKISNMGAVKSSQTSLSKTRNGYLTLTVTLAAGLLIGAFAGLFVRLDSRSVTGEQVIQPARSTSTPDGAPKDLGIVTQGTPKSFVNPMFFSADQLLKQFPQFGLYYRYTSELPGVRPLQSTFYLAFNWFQSRFLPEATQPPIEPLDESR